MSRAQILFLHLATVLVTVTGGVFAWFKYFVESSDPFAVVNHPLQPTALSAHVLVSPLAVFAFGWIASNHIFPGVANRYAPKRASGLWSLAMIVPMVVSGYLIQVSTGETARRAMEIAHWISSGLFVVAYIVHLLGGRPPRTPRPQD